MTRMPKLSGSLLALFLVAPSLALADGDAAPCPPDSVKVGPACVDKYEASVWQIAPTNKALIKKVQTGTATLRDLTRAGAVLIGCELVFDAQANYPANFPVNGQWTPVAGSDPPSPGVYAVSVKGVRPTTCTSWFQAAQACQLSGKRLLRNAEWQDAATGTPDPGTADDGTSTCNVGGADPGAPPAPDLVATASRASCKSNWGAFDMIGNAEEWVADWSTLASDCNATWDQLVFAPGFGNDTACVGAPGQPGVPSALVRGGGFLSGEFAGVFSVRSDFDPSFADVATGFRCAR